MIISKMYSPLAENHATLGWSADGRLPLQPWDHFNILHLSQGSVHRGAKTHFLSVPFFLAVLRWSRQTRPKNKSHPLSLVSGHFLSGAIRLSVQVHSVCLSINTVCMCVCSLHVVMFYIILRLYKSTVAPGPSLGVGNREWGFNGV